MARCVICLDEISETSDCSSLACGHGKNVHRSCIAQWLKQMPRDQRGILTGPCPVCRAPLMEITDEYDRDFETRPSMLLVALHTVSRVGKKLFRGRPREHSAPLRLREEPPVV